MIYLTNLFVINGLVAGLHVLRVGRATSFLWLNAALGAAPTAPGAMDGGGAPFAAIAPAGADATVVEPAMTAPHGAIDDAIATVEPAPVLHNAGDDAKAAAEPFSSKQQLAILQFVHGCQIRFFATMLCEASGFF